MTRMTGPDCVVMCNLINTYIHTYIHTYIQDQCEWHRMTRMTGPDCVVMCNLINTYIHTYIHTYIYTYIHTYIRWSIASTKVLNCSQGISIPIRYNLKKGVRYANFEKYFLLRVWSRPAERQPGR